MTMSTALARMLRRTLINSALLFAALAGAQEMLLADPTLPPADVDRVVVEEQDGSQHEITDPAAVKRLVRFVRSRGGKATPIRSGGGCWFSAPDSTMSAEFYRGTELHAWISQNDETLLMGPAYVVLSYRETAEIRRLMRARDGEPAEDDRE